MTVVPITVLEVQTPMTMVLKVQGTNNNGAGGTGAEYDGAGGTGTNDGAEGTGNRRYRN